jgi:hypothetical protein
MPKLCVIVCMDTHIPKPWYMLNAMKTYLLLITYESDDTLEPCGLTTENNKRPNRKM